MKFVSVDGTWIEWDDTVILVEKLQDVIPARYQAKLWVDKLGREFRGPVCKSEDEAFQSLKVRDWPVDKGQS